MVFHISNGLISTRHEQVLHVGDEYSKRSIVEVLDTRRRNLLIGDGRPFDLQTLLPSSTMKERYHLLRPCSSLVDGALQRDRLTRPRQRTLLSRSKVQRAMAKASRRSRRTPFVTPQTTSRLPLESLSRSRSLLVRPARLPDSCSV